MAINLDAIRGKLNQLNNQGKSDVWKPKPGSQKIRIVPYQYRKDNPFLELYFHYEITNKSMLSPITNGNPDPIVEFADKLKSTGDKDDWLQGRKIEPKMRTYVPIVVRGKENEGVKFWGFGKTIYQELLQIIADPDYGDITDPLKGRDIEVSFTPAENGGYPKTSILVKPNQIPVTEDSEIAKKISTEQPKIEDLYPEPSYQEVEDALKKWINSSDDAEPQSPSDSVTSNSSPAKPAEQEASANTKQNVDEAFKNLFNNG